MTTRGKKSNATRSGDPPLAGDVRALAELVGPLLAIEGVDGVGRPVTRIVPEDLPPDMLGFVERLRGGSVEAGEELLLLTLSGGSTRQRRRAALTRRISLALTVLCEYAFEHGVSADALAALSDRANRAARASVDRPPAKEHRKRGGAS